MTEMRARNSTIVRPKMLRAPAPVRAAFGTLERLAPPRGARWATRLWCTPPVPPAPVRRHDPRPRPGYRFTVPVTGGGTVVAEAWGSGPVTYLVHGWGGWRAQLGGFVAPLVNAGHRVVTLDMPGHGEAGPGRLGGRRTTLVEMAEAVAAVAGVTGPAHGIVAHSAGASAAALAVRDGLPVQRLVFVSPMADPVAYTGMFAQALAIGPRTYDRFMRRLADVVRRDLAEFDLPARAAEAGDQNESSLPPLLVVHDREDRETPHADGRAIADSWPGATLVSTRGLGHRRLLTDAGVIGTIAEFLTAGAAVLTADAAAPVRAAPLIGRA